MSQCERTKEVASNLNTNTSDTLKELEKFALSNSTDGKSDKEVIQHELNPENNKAVIIPISDIHLGSTSSDKDKLNVFVDLINENEGYYTVITGDVAETATKTSVGMGLFEEDLHLRDQINVLSDILQPLADKNKILGIHTGNHEFRSAVLTGLNPMEVLSRYLGVPYLGWQAFHSLKVGENNYSIMSVHGTGSGRTTGSKINNAEKPAEVAPTLDIYLSGHSHIKSVHTKDVYYIDNNNELIQKEQYYLVCGSFLKYFGGYAEMKVLPPTSTGASRIELGAKNRYISVTL